MSSLQLFQFNSASLAETRIITVYLPPAYRTGARYPVIFCADGQAVPEFSHRLNEAIERESVPSVILIGVHSSDQYRAKEYIDGADEERFQAHERFFTDEIYRWAFAKFNLCASRERSSLRIVHGRSTSRKIWCRHCVLDCGRSRPSCCI